MLILKFCWKQGWLWIGKLPVSFKKLWFFSCFIKITVVGWISIAVLQTMSIGHQSKQKKKLALKKRPVCHQARHDFETNSPCKDYTNCAESVWRICILTLRLNEFLKTLVSIWYPFVFVWFTAYHKKYLSN